jgi:hypothetical protein
MDHHVWNLDVFYNVSLKAKSVYKITNYLNNKHNKEILKLDQ